MVLAVNSRKHCEGKNESTVFNMVNTIPIEESKNKITPRMSSLKAPNYILGVTITLQLYA